MRKKELEFADIDLRHLRYFLTVAHEGSISRAARALHTSQPSLGKQIRDLESRVGVPLFHRRSNKMLLTRPGRLFHQRAGELLENWSAWIARAGESESTRESRLVRILTSEPVAASLSFAGMLRGIHEVDPNLPVQVLDPAEDPAIYRLMDGEVDLVCMLNPPASKELEFLTLATEAVLAVLPSAHPIAAEGKPTTLSCLRKFRRIVFDADRYPAVAALERAVRKPRAGIRDEAPPIEVSHISTALDLVSRGEGCMLSFGLAYPRLSRSFRFLRVKDAPAIPLQLCWRRKSTVTDRSGLKQFLAQQAVACSSPETPTPSMSHDRTRG